MHLTSQPLLILCLKVHHPGSLSKCCVISKSGVWLNALPILAVRLHMDDNVVRITAGLNRRVPLCQPHLCSNCGTVVDEYAALMASVAAIQGMWNVLYCILLPMYIVYISWFCCVVTCCSLYVTVSRKRDHIHITL